MEPEIVSETKYAVVAYYADSKLLKLTWRHHQISFEEYKGIYRICLLFQKASLVNYFLSDARQQAIVPDEYRKWFEEYVLGAAVTQGLKKAAAIIEGNVFKRYYLNTILHASHRQGLPFKVFKTEDAALRWFLE